MAERPDDALITDDEVFQLKGGYYGLIFKSLFGFGAVFAYLLLTKRINEIKHLEIRGSTFLMSNLIFLSSATYCQTMMLNNSSNNGRYYLHKGALLQRLAFNLVYMNENLKKPKIH